MADGDLDLMDTVDGVPLRLILAVKGVISALVVHYPDSNALPAGIADALIELCDVWQTECDLARAGGAAERSGDGGRSPVTRLAAPCATDPPASCYDGQRS
jgi:hypothetical protein